MWRKCHSCRRALRGWWSLWSCMRFSYNCYKENFTSLRQNSTWFS